VEIKKDDLLKNEREEKMIKSKETLKTLFELLLKSRLMEEELLRIQQRGELVGLVHSCIGQEAIPIGATIHMKSGDGWNCARGHVQSNLTLGMDLKCMFSEFLGKRSGYCKGKGGKVHLCHREIGNMGFRGVQGGFFPLTTGVAFSNKYRGTDNVAVCFFGDGASNQGTFFESLNLASLHKLPIVFVCANNQWSISTHIKDQMLIENIADRAPAFSLPGVIIDGNDIEEVYEVAGEAIKRARQGGGPTLIEAKTYRMRGHQEADLQRYRTKEEVEKWKERDPLKTFTEKCLERKVIDEQEIEKLRVGMIKEIEEALEFAKKAPYPGPEELLTDVYWNEPTDTCKTIYEAVS